MCVFLFSFFDVLLFFFGQHYLSITDDEFCWPSRSDDIVGGKKKDFFFVQRKKEKAKKKRNATMGQVFSQKETADALRGRACN